MVSISIDSHNFSPFPDRQDRNRRDRNCRDWSCWPIACPCLSRDPQGRAITNSDLANPFPSRSDSVWRCRARDAPRPWH